MSKKNIGILLSGSGVFDGTEIHEAVFTLLAVDKRGGTAVCFAPDDDQHHVINHLNGEELNEKRNILIESARIARGEVQDVTKADVNNLDALIIPGGFGTAKNHTKWAFEGPAGPIRQDVKNLITAFVAANKPILGLCMAPTTIAKALEGSDHKAKLTVGTTEKESPYDIKGISEGVEKTGATAEMKAVNEITIDEKNNIITAPCYMMKASVSEVCENIDKGVDALFSKLS